MKTTLRALVMLTVLVGMPSAWVYYGPLPTSAQRVVDRFVASAKETLGWDEPSPYRLADGNDVNCMPGPRTEGAAPPFTETMPAAPVALPPVVEASNPLEPLLARLRELGVAEYALERWGASGELYRFHCEMPLGPSEGFTQQFEAVASDPQASVEQVVSEVASWHIARSGDTMLR